MVVHGEQTSARWKLEPLSRGLLARSTGSTGYRPFADSTGRHRDTVNRFFRLVRYFRDCVGAGASCRGVSRRRAECSALSPIATNRTWTLDQDGIRSDEGSVFVGAIVFCICRSLVTTLRARGCVYRRGHRAYRPRWVMRIPRILWELLLRHCGTVQRRAPDLSRA